MNLNVRLVVHDDSLSIKLPERSPFLTGTHRIFLANIMGLEEYENGTGYYLEKAHGNVNDTLVDLVDYFKKQAARIEYNEEAGSIAKAFSDDSDSFEKARVAGLQLKHDPPATITIPNFVRTLKPYQVGPVAHLVSVGNGANFSVPGSGKTTVTLAAYSLLKKQGAVRKIMVIGPRAAFMSWEDEYQACFGKNAKTVRVTGPVSVRKGLYRAAEEAELVLLTYQMASQDVNRLAAFLRDNPCMLVLDESHNIKRLEGGKWANALLSIASFATRRVILTGTPVPNSLEDLWSQMTFLWPNPKILGTVEEYKDKLSREGNLAAQVIKEELQPFYWRIHKSQLKLRAPKYHWMEIKMRPYQKAIYDALAAKVLAEVVRIPEERSLLRRWRRARIIRLLQTASNPALLTESSEEFEIPPMDATGLSVSQLIENYPKLEVPPKIEAIVNLVEQLVKNKEKVLIWTSFIHNIKTLAGLLKKYEPRIIYGDVPKDKTENDSYNRENMIREFKTSKKYNILIANPSACAESVSLHKVCHHAIYLDRTFNCAQYMQSLDRIHRIGLDADEQVHYYIFQTKDSIDQVINQRLLEKQKQLLELLNDDFALLDLESSSKQITEEADEEADFIAVIRQLKTQYE